MILSGRKKYFLPITLLLLLWNYSSFGKNQEQNKTKSESPLVFIHGIKGSVLADKKTNKISWLTPGQASLFPLESADELSDGEKNIKGDFFDPNDWENLKIGPFAYSFSNNEVFRKHFSRALLAAKIFRKKLTEGKLLHNGVRISKQPKVFVILGKSQPTFHQIIKNGPKSYLGWDFISAPKKPGDGRVTMNHAYPPSGIEYEEFESKFEHSDLLNDPAVLNWIFTKDK